MIDLDDKFPIAKSEIFQIMKGNIEVIIILEYNLDNKNHNNIPYIAKVDQISKVHCLANLEN